jgi:hypothetical protein
MTIDPPKIIWAWCNDYDKADSGVWVAKSTGVPDDKTYITIAASDARVEAAVRAVMEGLLAAGGVTLATKYCGGS